MCNILNGTSKSCGCLNAENTAKRMSKTPGTAATNQVLGYYRTNARRRRIQWKLTRAEAIKMLHAACFYCGVSESMTATHGKDVIHHNGIDRVDSSSGYAAENCVPCCKNCNRAKATMTIAEFATWVERVYTTTKARLRPTDR